MHNKGLGLYKDHIVGNQSDDDEDTPGPKKPLSSVTTNINNDGRKKDFAAHWEMTDDSKSAGAQVDPPPKVSEDRKKVVKGMDANWGLYEQSPDQRKENMPRDQRGITTAGNGMGGRKGQARAWDFGDLADEEPIRSNKPAASGGKDKSFWDF